MEPALTNFNLNIARFKKDKYFRWSMYLLLIFYAGCFLLIIWFWQRLPPQVPLYYSLPWGEEQLAPPAHLVMVMMLLWLINFISVFMAFLLHQKMIYFSRMLLLSNVMILCFGIITIIKIIFLIS